MKYREKNQIKSNIKWKKQKSLIKCDATYRNEDENEIKRK